MTQFINLILERLAHFGVAPLCNGLAQRAPHLFGFCFPLCYRCTFIFIFFGISLWLCCRQHIRIPWVIIVLGMMIMIIDGGLQTFLGIMSTNLRRSLTGGIFGVMLGASVARLFIYLERES